MLGSGPGWLVWKHPTYSSFLICSPYVIFPLLFFYFLFLSERDLCDYGACYVCGNDFVVKAVSLTTTLVNVENDTVKSGTHHFIIKL